MSNDNYIEFPPCKGKVRVLPIRVIDGDTVEVCLLIKRTIRLVGINAPELHGEKAQEGQKAKKRLCELLPIDLDNIVECEIVGKDKFQDRLDGIIRTSQGKSVADILVEEGLAKVWDGKGQRPLCIKICETPEEEE
jgi:endonuclease YncB( thermonuclease family)